MDTGASSLIAMGVWLIPFLLLFILAGFFLLGGFWRNQAQMALKKIGEEIDLLYINFHNLSESSQTHLHDLRGPFERQAIELRARLERVQDLTADLQKQYLLLEQRLQPPVSNPWQAIAGAPFFAHILRKETASLQARLTAAQQALAAASASIQAVEDTGWVIAQQAREVRHLHQRLSRVVQELQAKNLTGEALNNARQTLEWVQSEINQIPAHFLSGGRSSVLRHADKESIVAVHAALAHLRPELENLLDQAQDWGNLHSKALDQQAAVQGAVEAANQAISVIPKAILIPDLTQRLGRLKITSESLQARLAMLPTEEIPDIIQEQNQVIQQAQEIEKQLHSLLGQHTQLGRLLSSLWAGEKQATALCARLASHAAYPVVWTQTQAALLDLNQRISFIGSADKTRSPEDLQHDLEWLQVLSARQAELLQACQAASDQHHQLVSLLSGPELNQVHRWLHNARQTANQAAELGADNWARLDNVFGLSTELHTLEEQAQRLAPAALPSPIQEGELAERLKASRRLADDAQALRTRLETIQRRLESLQQLESQAQDQLNETHMALNQIAYIVRSNDYLKKVAALELERIQSGAQRLLKELADRTQGAVEKKARAAANLSASAVQDANRWLEKLSEEIQTQAQRLSGWLAQLDNIAPLEDAPIAKAHQLLAASPSYAVNTRAARRGYAIGELVAELKQRSDFWHNLMSIVWGVESLHQQVTDSYQEASASRQETHLLIADFINQRRQAGAWPPTSVSLDGIRQEFNRIEEQWQAVEGVKTNAINLVKQLSSLSGRYQTLAERARQAQERARKEQEQIAELEADLFNQIQLWQTQQIVYADNTLARQEIQALIDEIQQTRSQLRRQYQQGSRDYDQIVQTLKNLQRKVLHYLAPLDNDHSIDADGNVFRRR